MANSSKDIILKLVVDVKDSKKNLSNLNKEFNKTSKELRNVNRWQKATNGSIEKYQAANVILRKRLKNINQETEVGRKKAIAYRKVIDKNTEKLRSYSDSMVQQKMNIGNYSSALDGLKDRFPKISGAISAMMGPIGMVVGGVSAIVGAFVKFNQQIVITNKEFLKTKTLFNTSSEEARILQTEIRSLASIYDIEFNEVLKASNVLVKEFGISATGALNLINSGFEKGANINDDYLDTLREYSSQLARAGISADEFNSIITQSVREGIYSDKGIDAIKEAAIRIREMTPATEEALNKIGMSGSKIQKELKDGSRTLFSVIQEISNKLSDVSEDGDEMGKILANVFGGPGEDAGIRYIKMLGNMKDSMEDLKEETNEFNESSKELSKSWEEFSINSTQSTSLIGKMLGNMKEAMSDFLQKMTFVSRSLGEMSFDWLIIENAIKESNEEYDIFLEKMDKAKDKNEQYSKSVKYYTEMLNKSIKDFYKSVEEGADIKVINSYKNEIKGLDLLLKKISKYKIQPIKGIDTDLPDNNYFNKGIDFDMSNLEKSIRKAIERGFDTFDDDKYENFIKNLDRDLDRLLGKYSGYDFIPEKSIEDALKDAFKETEAYFNYLRGVNGRQKEFQDDFVKKLNEETEKKLESAEISKENLKILNDMNKKYQERFELMKKNYKGNGAWISSEEGKSALNDYEEEYKKMIERLQNKEEQRILDIQQKKIDAEVKRISEIDKKEFDVIFKRFNQTVDAQKIASKQILINLNEYSQQSIDDADSEYEYRVKKINQEHKLKRFIIHESHNISMLNLKKESEERLKYIKKDKAITERYQELLDWKKLSLEKQKENFLKKNNEKEKERYKELLDWKNEQWRDFRIQQMYRDNDYDRIVYENKKDYQLFNMEEYEKILDNKYEMDLQYLWDRNEADKKKIDELIKKGSISKEAEINEKLELDKKYEKESAALSEKYEKIKQRKKLELYTQYVDLAANITNQLLDATTSRTLQKYEDQLYSYNKMKDEEIEKYNETNNAIQESDDYTQAQKEEYQRRTRERIEELDDQKAAKDLEIRRKQAQYEKKMALFEIAINTAVAVMKSAPNPFAIASSIALGLTQAAVVSQQPLPQYADGGLIEGPGTGRSDSITARVSNGEYIINAESTKQYQPVLDSINSGDGTLKIDDDSIVKIAKVINDKKVINVATETQSVIDNVNKIKNNSNLF